MPEIPDLEIFSKNLNKRLSGKQVTDVIVHQTKSLNVTAEVLTEALKNATLSEVKREGKTTHFVFSNQQVLEVHLKLMGEFDIVSDETEVRDKILCLRFDEPDYLVISDSRLFAILTLNPKPVNVPDAMELTLPYLEKQLKKKKAKNIKAFLIDQRIVRGIGNAYADEILWESRISPESLCGKIPDDAVNTLFNAIKVVLKEATEQLEEVKPDLIKGEYREFLKVHHPQKKVSPTGQLIHCKKIASKKTYYTDDQQCYN